MKIKEYVATGISYDDIMLTGKNGRKYANRAMLADEFHLTDGNSKTGTCWNFNFSIEYSCRKDCECYTDSDCYACNNCYLFADNQVQYSENFNFYVNSSDDTWIKAMSDMFNSQQAIRLCRYFTCGDIPDIRFIKLIVRLAKLFPDMNFWTYTKKYAIVNRYCEMFGKDSIPSNLCIIFSHWMNHDGSYFPMDNPFNFPTSEFIPYGREDLEAQMTHICPCSDPNVLACCADCEHPCYKLTEGQHMGLKEHSTKQTKARDKEIREAHKRLKTA